MASCGVAEVSLSVNFYMGNLCTVYCFKREAQDNFDWILILRNCEAHVR